MLYDRFLTKLSKKRQPDIIREIVSSMGNASPNLIFLAGGLPNPKLFPFESMKINLKDGVEIDIKSDKMIDCLQYGPTIGYSPLIKQLKELTLFIHKPPNWENTEICVTTGSQDALCKSIEMLMQPNDYVLIQEPCYTGALGIFNPYSPRYLPIKSDDKGIIPESLLSVLSKWTPEQVRDSIEDIPKLLYLIPNAANPTGVSISTERRHMIYKIAQQYDLIILEDDPYYFVQFEERKNFSPTFLSLDTDGRVLHFDSFSKVISSGIRLGYVTGPKPLIERIVLHKQVADLHSSALSQVVIHELLNKWGIDGFLAHTLAIQQFYTSQRNAMLKSADKYLTGLCEWAIPTGGMFLWIKILGISDTKNMILERGTKKDIMVVPGQAFMTDSNKPSPYMRASFSVTSPENIDIGFQNLASLIKEELQIQH